MGIGPIHRQRIHARTSIVVRREQQMFGALASGQLVVEVRPDKDLECLSLKLLNHLNHL
jgi:hypothetical protein